MTPRLNGAAARRPLSMFLATTLLLQGCYSYAPVRGEFPAQGSRVRVQLSEPQDVRLAQITANDVVRINGEVVRADTGSLLLSTWFVQSRSGYENIGQGETAVIPRRNIVSVEKNQLSLVRTAGLLGVAMLLGVLIRGAVDDPSGTRTPGGNGQPQ